MAILGGGVFLMSEVPLYLCDFLSLGGNEHHVPARVDRGPEVREMLF